MSSSGERVPYDYLILATGARNRTLPVAGADRSHVFYLRTLAEAITLRERIDSAQSVAVIGGGFIGLEVAAAARSKDKRVTVIEALPRLMARAVCPLVSEYFLTTHRAHG